MEALLSQIPPNVAKALGSIDEISSEQERHAKILLATCINYIYVDNLYCIETDGLVSAAATRTCFRVHRLFMVEQSGSDTLPPFTHDL